MRHGSPLRDIPSPEPADQSKSLILATGNSVGDLFIFDAEDPSCDVARRVACHRNMPILFVAGVPELGIVVTASEGSVRTWDWVTFQLRMHCVLHEQFSKGAIMVCPRSASPRSPSLNRSLGRNRSRRSQASRASVSLDGAMSALMIVGSTRGSVRCVDLRMGHVAASSCSADGNRRAFFTSALPGDHLGAVVALAVSPQLFRFASAGMDGALSVFDGERTLLRNITLAEPIGSVAFVPDSSGGIFVGMENALEMIPAWAFEDAASRIGASQSTEDAAAAQIERVNERSFVEARGSVSDLLPWGGDLKRARDHTIKALAQVHEEEPDEVTEHAVAPERPWSPIRPGESGRVPDEGTDAVEYNLPTPLSTMDLWEKTCKESEKAAKKNAKEMRRRRRVERKHERRLPAEEALRKSVVPTIRQAIVEFHGNNLIGSRSENQVALPPLPKAAKGGATLSRSRAGSRAGSTNGVAANAAAGMS